MSQSSVPPHLMCYQHVFLLIYLRSHYRRGDLHPAAMDRGLGGIQRDGLFRPVAVLLFGPRGSGDHLQRAAGGFQHDLESRLPGGHCFRGPERDRHPPLPRRHALLLLLPDFHRLLRLRMAPILLG